MSLTGPGCALCRHTGRVPFDIECPRDEIPCPGCSQWTAPPARPLRSPRHHLVGAILWCGDMLVIAGRALGRLADRLDPHP